VLARNLSGGTEKTTETSRQDRQSFEQLGESRVRESDVTHSTAMLGQQFRYNLEYIFPKGRKVCKAGVEKYVNNYLFRAGAFFESARSRSWSSNDLYFTEPKRSLPCSQKPSVGPYPIYLLKL
jgi:hypothetical protein